MKYTTVAELRSHLAAWLRRVERGERVLIKRHGAVIAELHPPPADARAQPDPMEQRLEELEKEGFLRRPSCPWPAWARGSIPGETAPVLEALLAERDEER